MTRTILSIIALLAVAVCVPSARAADTPRPEGHHEVPDDPYIAVPRGSQATSPGAIVTRGGFTSVQVNVNGFGMNIVGDAGNEPSIAVDPTNGMRMAIGWRQFDTITNNFRQAGWGYTTNGGASWTFPGRIDAGVFRSDPVLDSDAEGNFYYNSLTADAGLTQFWCNVYKSTDGGATWDNGVYAYGGDKQWQEIDRTGGIGHGNIYAFWTRFFTCPGCNGHFTRSYDGGATFLDPIDIPGTPQWGVPSVGPGGELYIAGDGFTLAKSSTIQNSALPVAWDYSMSVSLGGSISFQGGPNPAGLLGQVWVATDHSGGPTHGNVYMLCSVQPFSSADPLDVHFSRSVDGGQTWSTPVRVNDDPSNSNAYQWLGTMSVAPNGRIDTVWLDTRADPGGYDSELYYSSSTDAGVTWSANQVLGPPFDPHVGWPQQNKMGDYFDMWSDDMGADLAYAATYNGEQDVYYIRIGERCSEAGTVKLDSPKYGCQSAAEIDVLDCGLNTDDGVIEQVVVDIDSDTETGVEQVTLTETAAASAWFVGSIGVDTVDSAGMLQVAEGDTITVTYTDADNGQGQNNIPVTTTATVDCTFPLISNVQTTDIQAFTASVTFDTDEATTGTIHYGLSCGATTSAAPEAGYHTSHSVSLTGLNENTTYAYWVEAADEAGNAASDDNGTLCYTFMTPDIPSYFAEEYSSNDNDLDFTSLTFTPNLSQDFYAGCSEAIVSLPTDPNAGTLLSLSEDGSTQVNLTGGQTVSLYGVSYGSFYVGSNGYLTFTGSDTDWTETLAEHFSMPRISVFYDDFSPQNGGTVKWNQLADRVVVSFQNMPEYNTQNSSTFQVEMHYSGKIVLSYLSLDASDGLVGLSGGGGVPTGFIETDLSNMGACMIDCNSNGIPDDQDIIDCVGDLACADCNSNGRPDGCDIDDGVSADCQPNNIPDDCEADADGDGVPDICDICAGGDDHADSDGDSVPDFCDICAGGDDNVDTDGDTVPDFCDVCPLDNPDDPDGDGVCTSNDNCNLSNPDQLDCQPNGIGDVCDLGDGTSNDNNGNGVPDECDALPPLPEDSLGASCTIDGDCENSAVCVDGTCYVGKNRYLSVAPNPGNAGSSIGLRISLDLGGGQTAVLGWVGAPTEVAVAGPELTPQLLCRIDDAATPYYRDWTVDDGGQPWTSHVAQIGDCEVSPQNTYLIQSIVEGVDTSDEANYSAPLVLPTVEFWGDVIGESPGKAPDGNRNFKDISAVVRGFQSVQSEPKVWLDLQGGVDTPEVPDFTDINLSDISHAVAGFQGGDYSFALPCACPGQSCP